MKKKIKSTIALLGALILAFTMSSFVFAADDIILDGDEGASSLIGKYSAENASGYKYMGFATTKEATSAYKYLELTYKGDITYLRIEFNREDDSNEGPFWFNPEGQTMFFKTVDGSAIPLTAEKETKVILDLSAIGINIGEFRGLHLHYLDPSKTKDSFEIVNAKLMTSAPGAKVENNAPAGDTDDVAEADTKASASNSGANTPDKPGTEGTAGGAVDAPSTGSPIWPIAVAVGGIAVAGIAFVTSKRLKED